MSCLNVESAAQRNNDPANGPHAAVEKKFNSDCEFYSILDERHGGHPEPQTYPADKNGT
jgi:hypothetical protein